MKTSYLLLSFVGGFLFHQAYWLCKIRLLQKRMAKGNIILRFEGFEAMRELVPNRLFQPAHQGSSPPRAMVRLKITPWMHDPTTYCYQIEGLGPKGDHICGDLPNIAFQAPTSSRFYVKKIAQVVACIESYQDCRYEAL